MSLKFFYSNGREEYVQYKHHWLNNKDEIEKHFMTQVDNHLFKCISSFFSQFFFVYFWILTSQHRLPCHTSIHGRYRGILLPCFSLLLFSTWVYSTHFNVLLIKVLWRWRQPIVTNLGTISVHTDNLVWMSKMLTWCHIDFIFV